jgi:hypothetical protein
MITLQGSSTVLARQRATTLVELMIAMVTVVLVLGAAMGAYIYGLKMVQVIQPKLTASDHARKTVSLVTEDVRAAFEVAVGNRTNGAFLPVPSSRLQTGNALRIFPSTNTNQFIVYFWDSTDKMLKRTTNNTTYTAVVAASVSNNIVFTAEDFRGNIISNYADNHVIGLTLQFYQIQYPTVAVGPGNYYDWYQLRSKMTRRTFF